jgi:hypothetical protein
MRRPDTPNTWLATRESDVGGLEPFHEPIALGDPALDECATIPHGIP